MNNPNENAEITSNNSTLVTSYIEETEIPKPETDAVLSARGINASENLNGPTASSRSEATTNVQVEISDFPDAGVSLVAESRDTQRTDNIFIIESNQNVENVPTYENQTPSISDQSTDHSNLSCPLLTVNAYRITIGATPYNWTAVRTTRTTHAQTNSRYVQPPDRTQVLREIREPPPLRRIQSNIETLPTYQAFTPPPGYALVQTESLSTAGIENENEVVISASPVPPRVSQGPPPLAGAPPSYSAVMRIGPIDSDLPYVQRTSIRIQPSPPFIAPLPPPTYSQAQGLQTEHSLIITSVEQMALGPVPVSTVCPRCAHVVVTTTQTERSSITHFFAFALCFCGCWPCCLLPYCMDACKNTYHHCPNCQQYLGMYRPW